MAPRPETDPLARYRQKRAASRTPEPFGSVHGQAKGAGPLQFVIQQHAARRMHHDFRLEWGGVLKSWAVPQGPSADPADKRLAVEVEDHPVEYADFEGIIPRGEYGAGPVIVWDRGAWTPIGDFDEGYRKGKLLFTLQGYKLRGEWTLVRTRRNPREWLLLKHRDAWADPGRKRPPSDASVLSGLTLAELKEGPARTAGLEAELVAQGAVRRAVEAERVRPMLAQAAPGPFGGPGWIFEIKWDGWRALCERRGAGAVVRYRSGAPGTAAWPEIARALRALPCERALLDGEIVVLGTDGKPRFQALQQRARLEGAAAAQASVGQPATLMAFDLLALGDLDLRGLPLLARKEALRRLLPREGPLRFADHVAERGEAFFEAARAQGLEGMVGKRADAPYREGRSPAWRKVRAERTGDLAVIGFTAPGGSGRVGLGALQLAVHDGCGLVYAGSVGTGFTDRELQALRDRLEAQRRPEPVCPVPREAQKGSTWVEPTLCVEVRFLEWTEEGLLRHPAFVRLREDKRPEECVREGEREKSAPGREPPFPLPRAGGGEGQGEEAPLVFSNLEKPYFPEDGFTKGHLIEWYRTVAPWFLPYLKDRPLVLTRYPDGIHGKSFFQKDAPEWTPAWVRRVRVWSEERGAEVEHFVCDDERTLLYLANLGTIPIHLWSSRAPELSRPDWCIIDLDPKEAPFAHVIQIARAARELCDDIELPCHVKTTGQSGLHLLVPLGQQLTHEQSRQLAGLLGRVLCDRLPAIATMVRTPAARGGKVYVDTLQNGQGKTIAAPYCVRPRPGAPVSAPLRWSEVNPKLDPRSYTIRTMPARLRRQKADPLLPVLGEKPDLVAALARLQERLA
ncbi:MAG: DNA ligase D [Deltaproteobacteria bacterium]|nr:DNA ligase D [Deltaproteobacteria bacterium]